MLYLALVVGLSTMTPGGGWWWSRRAQVDGKQQQQQQQIDVVFCDGVSAMIPLLRFPWKFPVLFYCHFPDKLLCTDRASLFKRCYRAPLDWIEESTTGASTLIAVNSKFTAQVFAEAFPNVPARHATPAVIYPAINLESFVPPKATTTVDGAAASAGKGKKKNATTTAMRPFVSLNRFERKKNIGLALEALALVRTHLHKNEDQNPNQAKLLKDLHLIIAGGYDDAVLENKEYMDELQSQAQQLGLSDCISFQPSISDATRATLLQEALAVLYTPDREHFGIVPLEAMYAGSPVLAVASGGPLETVLDGKTGFLCEGTGRGFAEAMLRLVREPELKEEMGRAGHGHVKEKFGLDAFAATLEKAVLETRTRAREGGRMGWGWRGGGVVVVVGVMMLAWALSYK
jgi:glycosyltransferase involved in cell wall biosynthesis